MHEKRRKGFSTAPQPPQEHLDLHLRVHPKPWARNVGAPTAVKLATSRQTKSADLFCCLKNSETHFHSIVISHFDSFNFWSFLEISSLRSRCIRSSNSKYRHANNIITFRLCPLLNGEGKIKQEDGFDEAAFGPSNPPQPVSAAQLASSLPLSS
jgi:hypothetical protein